MNDTPTATILRRIVQAVKNCGPVMKGQFVACFEHPEHAQPNHECFIMDSCKIITREQFDQVLLSSQSARGGLRTDDDLRDWPTWAISSGPIGVNDHSKPEWIIYAAKTKQDAREGFLMENPDRKLIACFGFDDTSDRI